MLILSTICGLVIMLAGGFFWAVRAGKKMNRLEHMEKGQKVVKDLNKFNREVDKKTKAKISNDRSSVRGAWLRPRD